MHAQHISQFDCGEAELGLDGIDIVRCHDNECRKRKCDCQLLAVFPGLTVWSHGCRDLFAAYFLFAQNHWLAAVLGRPVGCVTRPTDVRGFVSNIRFVEAGSFWKLLEDTNHVKRRQSV